MPLGKVVLDRPYERMVRDTRHVVTVFAHTYWGNDKIRWYWTRDADGKEKAYSGWALGPTSDEFRKGMRDADRFGKMMARRKA